MTARLVFHVYRSGVIALLLSLIVVALLSLGGRLLIGNIGYFRADIENELDAMGIGGVSLDHISGRWHGLKPVLSIDGASLSVPGRSKALLIDELELSVDVITSLLRMELKIGSVRAEVTKLILIRDEQGGWWLNDLGLARRQQGGGGLDFYSLFQQLPDYVSLDIGLLQIRDAKEGVDHLIQNSQVQSHRVNDRLDLVFTTRLPHTLGGDFEVRFSGDRQRQKLYVEAIDLNPGSILDLLDVPREILEESRVSLQSWLALEGFQPRTVSTRVSNASVVFRRGERLSAPLTFALDQRVERSGNNWRIQTRVDGMSLEQRQLPPMQLSMRVDSGGDNVVVAIDRVEANGFLPLLTSLLEDRAVADTLAAMKPELIVEDLIARINTADPAASAFVFSLQKLSSMPHGELPGVSGLAGRVSGRGGDIRLEMPAQPMQVSFTRLFRQPILLDRFSAVLSASLDAPVPVVEVDDIRLENEDVNVAGRAWFELAAGQMPFMMLRLDYNNGKVESTGRYLPVSIMPKNTVKWLDRALKGGRLTNGGLMYHGRLSPFSALERDQSGVFHASFSVSDPVVEFLPGWPRVQQGQGRGSFRNLAMQLEFEDVQLAQARVEDVDVSIDNMLHPLLRIEAEDRSDSESLLRTLASLPPTAAVDKVMQTQPGLGGEVDTGLTILVPLDSDRPASVKARAMLHDASVKIADWMVDFSRVNGVVTVDNERIMAEGLKARYKGAPVRVDVTPDAAARRTDLRLRGKLKSRELLALAPPAIAEPVSGQSHWDITVSIPNDGAKGNGDIEIKAHSSLQGTRIDAPAPLAVSDDDMQGLSFAAGLGANGNFSFVASLPTRLKASGMLKNDRREGLMLDYLDLNFAEQEYPLKDNGVNLTGVIERLDADAWREFLISATDDDLEPGDVLHRIKSIDLEVGQLHWNQRVIRDLSLEVGHRGDRLAGTVDSSMARGSFELPFRISPASPLRANLDYIRLEKKRETDKQQNKERPRLEDMPSVLITARELRFGDMQFDDFILQTVAEPDRFVIERLDMSKGEVELASSGQWQYSRGIDRHVTVFNVKVIGEKFGTTISELGLGDSLRQGAVDFEGQIGWSGSLFDINWPTLIGEVSLSLKDGYLNNVEPGAGRFVGLLSLNALPKRLFLDFGDVLSEGMQFDEISGDFVIKGELMSTENATMDGASAKVEMSGETNLRHKTYNQHMLIVPKVGETLPVLGSIAAGSSVGWALLLIQKIFKKPIEKSVSVEYLVTGSWDEPELTLITDPQEAEDETESELLNDIE